MRRKSYTNNVYLQSLPLCKSNYQRFNKDCNDLKKDGVNTVAIMSNDTKNYPEDSFDNMIKFAKENNFEVNINYLIDETQEIAKKYNAVCTPDFFGYNKRFRTSIQRKI